MLDEFKKEYYLQAIRELTVRYAQLRKRFEKIKQGGGVEPPEGYEFADYIQSDGSGNIVTQIYLDGKSDIEFVYQRDTGTRASNVLGCYSGTSDAPDNFSCYVGITAPQLYLRYDGQVQRVESGNNTQYYKIKFGVHGIYVNDVKSDLTYTPDTFTTSTALELYSIPNSTQNKLKGRLGTIKIYENNKLVHELRPCGQWSYVGGGGYEESNPAFYDTKTGTLYTAGRGFSVQGLHNYPEG